MSDSIKGPVITAVAGIIGALISAGYFKTTTVPKTEVKNIIEIKTNDLNLEVNNLRLELEKANSLNQSENNKLDSIISINNVLITNLSLIQKDYFKETGKKPQIVSELKETLPDLPIGTQTKGELELTLDKCVRQDEILSCFVTLINKGSSKKVGAYASSGYECIDVNSGRHGLQLSSRLHGEKFSQISGHLGIRKLYRDVPVKGNFDFGGFHEGIKKVSLISIQLNGHEFVYRDITIQ